jgi:hypothetical protein
MLEGPMSSRGDAQEALMKVARSLTVHVENGQIRGKAPPGLPEGDLDLMMADPGDELSKAEQARLNHALNAAWRSLRAGRGRSGASVLADLRARK